jgi:hypothetical protein
MIVDAIRTKNIDDKPLLIFLEQRMDTVHNNKKMTDQKAFGATATLTSILDMIKRIIGAKIPA